MIFFDFARRNVRLHWLRSLLAILGVIIGVASITSMGILGNGIVLFVSENLNVIGDTVMVYPASGGGFLQGSQDYVITDRQLSTITRTAGSNPVIPVYSAGAKFRIGTENVSTTIYGLDPANIPKILGIAEGAFVRAPGSCMVGKKFAEEHKLRPGSRLRFADSGEQLQITGILSERGSGIGISPDYAVIVPERWYSQTYNVDRYDYVIIKMNDIRDIDGMTRMLDERLNRRETEVMVFSSKQFLDAIQTSFSTISLFTQAIGGISLVVAGISILNVMMMAVTERIREIGVMRSLGARRRDIRKMFLYEALILGLIGSAVGGVLAIGGGAVVSQFMLQSTKYVFVPSSLMYIPFGMSYGIGICLLSGLYPAWKASSLNPIEALRHD